MGLASVSQSLANRILHEATTTGLHKIPPLVLYTGDGRADGLAQGRPSAGSASHDFAILVDIRV